MVEVRNWECFEREVIERQSKFYIYGAGMVCKKILPIVHDNVIGVLDVNADGVKGEITELVSVIHPLELNDITEDEVRVLLLLSPFHKYQERTTEVKIFLEQLEKKIVLYQLNSEQICETGIIDWGSQKLLIDNLISLTAKKPLNHLVFAYPKIEKSCLGDYLKKLYEEPAEFVLNNGHVGLKEFDNGLITHKNGKKETIGKYADKQYSKHIWIFGDSRVSGMLLENKDTIASCLQKIIDDDNAEYEVVNCGIPGRDIERMVYQISNENLQESDYAILATGFYEYGKEEITNAFVWAEYIMNAANECKRRGVNFIYCNLPTLLEMHELTDVEKDVLQLFHTTEFREYSYEKIKKYNRLIKRLCMQNGIHYCDFAEEFEQRHRYGHVFINLHHYGPLGSQLIADGIYEQIVLDKMIVRINRNQVCDEKNKRTKNLLKKIDVMRADEEKIDSYINEIKERLSKCSVYESGIIGSIVMNANPFTLGHKYLVDKALEDCDFLIVFVVSEDSSYFTFKDRYQMVYENLKGYENVLVVPSGEFCISKSTFPEYFKKEIIQNEIIENFGDLEVFGEKIAPKLCITKRFVGSEPEDKITNQYNSAMHRMLPQYGVQVIEISRKKIGEGVISASSARRFLKERNYIELEELLPETTYKYLTELLM